MNNYWLEKDKAPEFWERTCDDRRMLKNLADIEPIIMDWLKNDEQNPLISFRCEDGSYVQFVRSEINVKTAFNVWQVWRIGTSSQCDKIVSCLVKEIGTNDCEKIRDGFVMPNEVRARNYEPKE